MMTQYRNNPPQSLGGSPVITVKDYLTGESLDVKSGRKTPIDMEKSNVLQFITADSTIVSIRPSGTEPKIKVYYSTKGDTLSGAEAAQAQLAAAMGPLMK